jgi:hypothetical protein
LALSLSRRTPSRTALHRTTLHRKIPKITLIAAGSALALAGIAAGTAAAWPGNTPVASASLADAASVAGSRAVAASTATDHVLAGSVHQVKVSGAAARQATKRQAIARERARDAARARAAARAAAARTAAARKQQAPARPAAAAQPVAASGSPQQIAERMLGSYGWSSSQFSCLQPLWKMVGQPHGKTAGAARDPGPPPVRRVIYFIASLFIVLVRLVAGLRHG